LEQPTDQKAMMYKVAYNLGFVDCTNAYKFVETLPKAPMGLCILGRLPGLLAVGMSRH